MVDRMVGIGSEHGDDQAGWLVAEMLRACDLPHVEVATVRQPLELLDHLTNCRCLVVVDACTSGASPGTIRRLEYPDSRIGSQHARTTHSFTACDALRLAEKLGCLPPRIVFYSVELQACQPESELSAAVTEAVPRVVACLVEELDKSEQAREPEDR
jgi:hydrogenase maturation protease